MASGAAGGSLISGIALEFPATGIRIVEMPWAPSSGSTPAASSGYTVRSAVAGGLLVRVVSLPGSHTRRQYESVLRSLR
jgi:hypothetical protein